MGRFSTVWLARLRRTRKWTEAQARSFMACWDITASDTGELHLCLRERTLTVLALSNAMQRAAQGTVGPRTRFVFDLSGVDDMGSNCSVICALFIHFVRQVGKGCRIVGLNPRLAAVMGFFLRPFGCIELEPAR